MSDLSNRVIGALVNHAGVVLPAVQELMRQAWDEGAHWMTDAAGVRDLDEREAVHNPYREEK
jgi:hypothetical protein